MESLLHARNITVRWSGSGSSFVRDCCLEQQMLRVSSIRTRHHDTVVVDREEGSP